MSKNTKQIIGVIIVLFGAFVFVIQTGAENKREMQEYSIYQSKQERACLEFLQNRLMDNDGGIYTNYLNTIETKDYATGHEILSESIGLKMLYDVERDRKYSFDRQVEFIKKNMLTPEGVLRWRIRKTTSSITESSATIDDLRVIRALFYGYEKWEECDYFCLAHKISKVLFEYGVNQNKLANDCTIYGAGSEIDLAYIDLFTMQKLGKIQEKWISVYQEGMKIIHNGYISDSFPFYYRQYQIGENRYVEERKIDMIGTLLTVLHLAEIGQADKASIEWIEGQLQEKGKIYSVYDVLGKQMVEEQSTAIYAIIMRIAKAVKNEQLYQISMRKMMQWQVLDLESEIYGAFGDAKTLQVFSFDNLQALVAWSLD